MTNDTKICHDKVPMRRLIILTSFFVAAPLLLVSLIVFYSYLSYSSYIVKSNSFNSRLVQTAYASQDVLGEQTEQEDTRVEMVRQFFARYQSPLEPYAQDVVYEADYYNIDWRLVPAIAMQESNLCKKAPKDSYNCWGFGIYGSKVTKFANYQDAIKAVTKTLATEYKEKRGLETPSQIMARYTPSNTGAWAYAVSHFIDALEIP